jgi:thiol-disulfide isomerase/thioredoxin
MEPLALAEDAAPLDVEVRTLDGAPLPLADALGERLTVLNFWATWCAPCLHEMPTLEALAADPPEGVAVIALSTGRDSSERIADFAREVGLDRLTLLRDPDAVAGRAAAVLGLPTTLILGPDGAELARLTGTADWNGPDARAAVTGLAAAFTSR